MTKTSTKKARGERGSEAIKNKENLDCLRDNLFKITCDYPCSLLEKKTKVSDSSIKAITNGDRPNPKIDNIISIAKGMNCSIDDLVGLNKQEEILTVESKNKLLNRIDFDRPDWRRWKIYMLNQIINSDYFDTFMRAFSNYQKFDLEKYEKEFERNEEINSDNHGLYLPTAKMYETHFEKELLESVILLADYTQRRISRYEKYKDIYKKRADELIEDREHGLSVEEYDEAIEKYLHYKEILEKHNRNWLKELNSEIDFYTFEEDQEKNNEEE